jgi:hypothetical protein
MALVTLADTLYTFVMRADKISAKTGQAASNFTTTLRNYALQEIPLFNVMEAICWIYTCCVDRDEIRTDPEAELYLNQLYGIFQVLKATC